MTPEKRTTYETLAKAIIRDLSIEDGAALIAQQIEIEARPLVEALRYIGEYKGEGGPCTPWRDIVRDCGRAAREALAKNPIAERNDNPQMETLRANLEDMRADRDRLRDELKRRDALIQEIYARAARLDRAASDLRSATDGLACLANPASEDRIEFDVNHGARCPRDTNGDGDCELCHKSPGRCLYSTSAGVKERAP